MFGKIRNHIMNIPGWKTGRKLVVIESDDWGSIRMPDTATYNALKRQGIRVDEDLFCKYDTLASETDLNELFNVLSSVKDKFNRPAVITANAVVANPDFDKIKAADFEKYEYETIDKTIQRHYSESVWQLWKDGITQNVFHPQFHGREHLNVKKWLEALRNNEFATKLAFEYRTFGLTSATSPTIKTHYMGAFNSNTPDDLMFYDNVITEGLTHFERLFGYRSKSFIATTYTWSPLIEPILQRNGVEYLQGLVHQRIPLDNGLKFGYKKGNFQGKTNSLGQIYLMRNSFFEPTHYRDKFDVVDDCLSRIEIAFRCHKAAVIGAHRLNFIGTLNENNRTVNLQLLEKLLKAIVKKWPDVEFVSSDELGEIISKSQKCYDYKP